MATLEFREEEAFLSSSPDPERLYIDYCLRKIELNLAYAAQASLAGYRDFVDFDSRLRNEDRLKILSLLEKAPADLTYQYYCQRFNPPVRKSKLKMSIVILESAIILVFFIQFGICFGFLPDRRARQKRCARPGLANSAGTD
jgi:hypothetical protein